MDDAALVTQRIQWRWSWSDKKETPTGRTSQSAISAAAILVMITSRHNCYLYESDYTVSDVKKVIPSCNASAIMHRSYTRWVQHLLRKSSAACYSCMVSSHVLVYAISCCVHSLHTLSAMRITAVSLCRVLSISTAAVCECTIF